MQIMIRILVPALVSITLGVLLLNVEKSNSKEVIENLTKEHIVIRLPKIYLWIGCLDISFFVACLIVMACFPNGTERVWVWILFGVFIVIGVVLVLETIIWKIEIFRSENYFVCRILPFKSYRILYSDCVNYKFGFNALLLKTQKRTFHIDGHATNFEFLLAMLTQYKVKEIK